jgi:nucleoside-diphosphate-sugar epimerase
MVLKNSLELARKNTGSKLTIFSSSEIYGDPDKLNIPTREYYPGNVVCLDPRACYDMRKRLVQTQVQIYHQHYGVMANIIRLINDYCPGMQKTNYRFN